MPALVMRLFLAATLFMLAHVTICRAASRISEITRLRELSWPQPPTRVNLVPFGGSNGPGGVQLGFSPDSQCLCGWWLPNPPIGDCNKLPGRCVVFDLNGQRIAEATDEQGELVGRYALMFPDFAWRRRFAGFVQNAHDTKTTLWGFLTDYSAGLRFLKPREPDWALGTAEYWRFKPTQAMAWSVTLPERVQDSGLVGFFETGGKGRLLVAFNGMDGYVLSTADGALLDRFTYGKRETDAELMARKRKFHLAGDDYAGSWHFSASALAFEPTKRLLACGDLFSRRVRVVEVGRPDNVPFEANTEDNPERPRGGVWSVEDLHFDGAGEFLIIGYRFGGRSTSKAYYPVEVYETHNWRPVWSVNTPEVRTSSPPRISPDGKRMAVVRGDWLEIGVFVPTLASGKR